MASNPPIAGLPASGSFSLQARIDRFLTTIEPHIQYFTNQGRSYLDSTLERDKAESRYLNHDKTGWASVPLGGTSLVDASGDISRGSEDSINAMSSVSQRGGRIARMRDRNGNTAADACIGDDLMKSGKVKTKTRALVTPIEVESSSSPIRPWKDIVKPTVPVVTSTLPIPTSKPLVSILPMMPGFVTSPAVDALLAAGVFPALNAHPLGMYLNSYRHPIVSYRELIRLTRFPAFLPGKFPSLAVGPAPFASNRVKKVPVASQKESIAVEVDDKSRRKRKHDVDQRDAGGKRNNSSVQLRRQSQRDESPDVQIVSVTQKEQLSVVPPAFPESKRRKKLLEPAALQTVSSKIKVPPKKETGIKIVENLPTPILDCSSRRSHRESGTLAEASSKLNSTTAIPEKKIEAKASVVVTETSEKKKSSKDVVTSLTAEEKAREESR